MIFRSFSAETVQTATSELQTDLCNISRRGIGGIPVMVWSSEFTYVNFCVLNVYAFRLKSSPNILINSDFIASNS